MTRSDTVLVVVVHGDMSPFGTVQASDGDLDDDNPFRFSSKYTDSETRLVYYGYRYLDTGMGRWVSRDPAGEWGGTGLYRALRNGPVGRYDELGLATQVSYKPPDLASITPILEGLDSIRSNRDLRRARMLPEDPMATGGWVTYHEMKVDCWCGCRSGSGKYYVKCVVTWNAKIHLNKAWDREAAYDAPLSMVGAYGHEQKHIIASEAGVRADPGQALEADNRGDNSGAGYSTSGDCERKAGNLGGLYTSLLSTCDALDVYLDHHKDQHPDDPLYAEQPSTGKGAPQVPNTPDIPPK